MAKSPVKNLMMTGFMLYMTGTGIHIFSIMMTFYAFINPLRGAFQVNQMFLQFEDKDTGTSKSKVDLTTPKIAFVVLSCVAASAGLYKLHLMGLLPLTSSDWVALLSTKKALEHSWTMIAP